jgi:hypothetical protein
LSNDSNINVGASSKDSTNELDTVAQGVGYLDYFQDGNTTLTELVLRLVLSGKADEKLSSKNIDPTGLGSNDIVDLTSGGTLIGSVGQTGLINRGSGLLGLSTHICLG